MARSKGNAEAVIEKFEFAVGAFVDDAGFRLRQRNARAVGSLTRRAKDNFRGSILRPQERNSRPSARQTGAFTFGQGQTFEGFLTETKNAKGKVVRVGFGYPKVDRADVRTNFVWRSLEYGLGKRGERAALAPRGRAKVPRRFTFQPFGEGGVLVPLSKRAATAGLLVSPLGKPLGIAENKGIAPKRFIRDAYDEIFPRLKGDYRQAVSTAFKVFK